MPDQAWNRRWGLELVRHAKKDATPYGLKWGDPSLSGIRYWLAKLRMGRKMPGNLSRVVTKYIRPYVASDRTVLEIGFGGGRWTSYLLDARRIILVELNREFFPYVEERFAAAAHKLQLYQTSGCELNGIQSASVDYVFSFGTFVHIELAGVIEYLTHVARVLKPGGHAVIQYADKSKRFFRSLDPKMTSAFSNVTADEMLRAVAQAGLTVMRHDRRMLNHSNILLLRR